MAPAARPLPERHQAFTAYAVGDREVAPHATEETGFPPLGDRIHPLRQWLVVEQCLRHIDGQARHFVRSDESFEPGQSSGHRL